MKQYNKDLIITGHADITKFTEYWSSRYDYKNMGKYSNNIKNPNLSEDQFYKIYEWKNGTGDEIAISKTPLVEQLYKAYKLLKPIKSEFLINQYEETVKPEKSAAIWKIFLLHILDPQRYPIFIAAEDLGDSR